MPKFESLLYDNLHDPFFSNESAALQLGISTRSLYRKVREASGLSPNHYLRKLRLDRAEELLRSGQYTTVKEVALRVGYLKVSYFSDQYEAQKGVRPSTYFKTQKEELD